MPLRHLVLIVSSMLLAIRRVSHHTWLWWCEGGDGDPVPADAGENGGPAPPEDMSRTQLFSKLVDEREKCRVERLKNRQNDIILEQVGCAV